MLVVATGIAHAEAPAAQPAEREERGLFVGISGRTDLGTRSVRASAAMRIHCVWLSFAIDPYGYIADVQRDTDIFVEWRPWRPLYSLFAGWRGESVPILGTHYWSEKAIGGASAEMPYRLFDRVRVRFSAELAFTAVQHGNELPTVWAWEHSRPFFYSFDVGMFVRVEYGFGGGS